MTYKFVSRPLENGLYEPEGIYLTAPFAGAAALLQAWGANRRFYSQFHYNGTALKGHPGVDFGVPPGTALKAVDNGRVMEISFEAGGFERYIKLEHRWGESFYAHIGAVEVESGQSVTRGAILARTGGQETDAESSPPHFHFAIRIAPYNRFDGWGGFSDPLPFMDPAAIDAPDEFAEQEALFSPPPLLIEKAGIRRP